MKKLYFQQSDGFKGLMSRLFHIVFCLFCVTATCWGGGRDYDRDYSGVDSLIAEIKTHEGTIRINLLFQEAPNTVANFEYLAKSKYYDGVIFHRVIQQFMIQTGDSTGTGRGNPGFTIDFEKNNLSHEIGMVSMANTGDLDSGASQFFIVQYPQPQLNGKHTIFGQVIDGLDVIYRIEMGDPMIQVKILEIKASKTSQIHQKQDDRG